MFRAIIKLFRSIGYLLTGRINKFRENVSQSPVAVQAGFDRIIMEKTERIQEMKNAVSQMITISEQHKRKIKQTSEEIAKAESIMKGVVITMNKRKAELDGDVEALKASPQYAKLRKAYADYSSTVEEKKTRLDEHQSSFEESEKQIAQFKIQMQKQLRELDKIRQEAPEAVATIISARQQEDIADMVNGISEDRSGQELAELRAITDQAKARARVGSEMAGMSVEAEEAAFLDEMTNNEAEDEFDKLLGIRDSGKETEQPDDEQPAHEVESREVKISES